MVCASTAGKRAISKKSVRTSHDASSTWGSHHTESCPWFRCLHNMSEGTRTGKEKSMTQILQGNIHRSRTAADFLIQLQLDTGADQLLIIVNRTVIKNGIGTRSARQRYGSRIETESSSTATEPETDTCG